MNVWAPSSAFLLQFCDVDGFNVVMDASPTPFVTIEIMNGLYAVYDHVISKYEVHKIETVNDTCLVRAVRRKIRNRFFSGDIHLNPIFLGRVALKTNSFVREKNDKGERSW